MKYKLVAVIQNTSACSAYTDEGKMISFPNGTDQAKILIDSLPQIIKNGFVEVELQDYVDKFEETFANMGMSFFRSAFDALNSFSNDKNVLEHLNQIADKAKPVAVIPNEGALNNVDDLSNYIVYANEMKNYKGLSNLIKRLVKIAKERRHSVEDALKFLNKADFPITESGSIIGYKVLDTNTNSQYDGLTKQPRYCDSYSHRVLQDVGYEIRTSIDHVDPDRTHECSYGLHIARRGYLKCFSGAVCMLVQFEPEDIIAVPREDPNKIRVCGYKVLAVLTTNQWNTLTQDNPIDDVDDGKELLQKAVTEAFPPCFKKVTLLNSNATDIKVEDIVQEKTEKNINKILAKEIKSVNIDAVAELKKQDVNLAKEAIKTANAVMSPKKAIINILAKRVITVKDKEFVRELRRKAKKSLKAMGFTMAQIKRLE